MDELLSEQEQLDQIREWWREYGWYLVGGVVLGAGLLYGKVQYDDYRQGQAESAAALFQEMRLSIADDADAEALALLEQLRTEYPSSPYTDQAGLLTVILYLQNQSTRQAIEALRFTLENTADEYLALVARTRLARLFVSAERHGEALALLDGVAPGNFSARFSEIRGDIYHAQGDRESAQTAYLQALNSDQSDLVDRGLIQMKLDDLAPPTAPLVEAEAPAEDDGA